MLYLLSENGKTVHITTRKTNKTFCRQTALILYVECRCAVHKQPIVSLHMYTVFLVFEFFS